MPESARAVVSDDGSTIWLTAYTAAGQAVPVALHPVRAVALAGELIEAAVPKLGIAEVSSVTGKVKGCRGGDRMAAQRHQRDADIRALALLMGEGNPTSLAEKIFQRVDRYRPASLETSAERQLIQRINGSGLPVRPDRIRKILGEQKTRLVTQTSPPDRA
jgi:hypothetical protein